MFCSGQWSRRRKGVKMKSVISVSVVVFMLCGFAFALPKEEEKAILMEVVHEYELNEDEARMLFAIRRHENGPVGMEFGIGQDAGPKHPARRYAGQPRKSLRLQAQWAAGTIKRRFNGNLFDFARIWCPKNPLVWYRSVYQLLKTEYAIAPR